jgi:hypothetical protein
MIKGTKFLLLILLLSWTNAFSQKISHQVLVPAAGLATAGVLNYSQTIGETAVETMGGSGFILTQGFQQPGMKYVEEPPHAGTGVEVYPNPATDYIKVKLFGESARRFRIEVINLTGTIVSSTTLDFITKYFHIQDIDASGLKLGFYIVRVTSDDSKIKRVFKIEKM